MSTLTMDERQKLEKQFSDELAKITKQLEEERNEKELLREQLNAISSTKTIKTIEHTGDFWSGIKNNCFRKSGPFGTDSIKMMIKTGKMTVHDTNYWKQTLLHVAAQKGAYDLAQFLINNGADLDAKSDENKTALDVCRRSGYSHIEVCKQYTKSQKRTMYIYKYCSSEIIIVCPNEC